MATVTKATDVSFDANTGGNAPQIAGDLLAGEALAANDFCYIKAADGRAWRTNATAAATETTRLAGVTPIPIAVGMPVTLLGLGVCLRYALGSLTPGAVYFLSATAPGGLDTAATTGDAVGVAQAISDTDIRVTRAI